VAQVRDDRLGKLDSANGLVNAPTTHTEKGDYDPKFKDPSTILRDSGGGGRSVRIRPGPHPHLSRYAEFSGELRVNR